jgi:hypothetical protein
MTSMRLSATLSPLFGCGNQVRWYVEQNLGVHKIMQTAVCNSIVILKLLPLPLLNIEYTNQSVENLMSEWEVKKLQKTIKHWYLVTPLLAVTRHYSNTISPQSTISIVTPLCDYISDLNDNFGSSWGFTWCNPGCTSIKAGSHSFPWFQELTIIHTRSSDQKRRALCSDHLTIASTLSTILLIYSLSRVEKI